MPNNTKFVLRTLVLAMAGAVLVFLGVGQLLADEWTISTTRTMSVSQDEVAGRVKDLSTWTAWSSLDLQLGNPTERSYEGAAGAVDQRVTWRGPVGLAVLSLDGVAADSVDYRLGYRFGPEPEGGQGDSFGGRFRGSIQWKPVGEQVEVTWTEHGQMDTLIQRWSNWFGALQDKVQQIQRASLGGLEEHITRARDGGR